MILNIYEKSNMGEINFDQFFGATRSLLNANGFKSFLSTCAHLHTYFYSFLSSCSPSGSQLLIPAAMIMPVIYICPTPLEENPVNN